MLESEAKEERGVANDFATKSWADVWGKKKTINIHVANTYYFQTCYSYSSILCSRINPHAVFSLGAPENAAIELRDSDTGE